MLKKYFSTWGGGIAGVYFVFALGLAYFAAKCTGFGCSGIVLLVALPWVILFEDGISLTFLGIEGHLSGWPFVWITVVFNILILYFIFAMLQKRAER